MLWKSNDSIRPIAIGDPFSKLASRVIAMQIKGKAAFNFAPLQYGIGVPSGAEIIVHASPNI